MRIRFRFSKLGKVRFTSQRDVARMWERALRRAELPLAYTEGFSPRPQLSFGLALPTACESLAEYLDVRLDDARSSAVGDPPTWLADRMSDLLPEGIRVERAVALEGKGGSLQELVTSCSWFMQFSGEARAVFEERVASALSAASLPITRERKGREEHDDLRPSVLDLRVTDGDGTGDDGRVGLVAELATRPRGVRPVELVRGLISVSGGPPTAHSAVWAGPAQTPDGTPVLVRACRTQQWIERDGVREEPLSSRGDPTVADRATHALERAS